MSGMTQQELGHLVTVSRQFVHQMESGDKSPADDVWAALAEVLKVKPAFFNHSIINDVKYEQCHFRKRKTTPVGLANRVLALGTIFELLVEILDHHLELPEPRFPRCTGRQSRCRCTGKGSRIVPKALGTWADGPHKQHGQSP
jgi:DNA-binding XRE family transcriptional regulator